MRVIKDAARRPVIGVTGGIGSGKSTVADHLRKMLGGTYIDADLVCRELLAPGEAGWRSFRESFGRDFISPDGSINRSLLRQHIFMEEEVRLRLNRVLHPLAKEEIVRRVEEDTGSCCFLLEIPLLYEAGWETEVDRVIVVYSHPDRCVERLLKRDRLNRREAEGSLAAQWPLAEKALLADHVINNNGPWAFTCLQILHLGKLLERIFQSAEGAIGKK